MPDAPDKPTFRPATGVEYRRIPDAPGLYFTCATLRATIRPECCADHWRSSQDPANLRIVACHRCQIGRQHAGEVQQQHHVDDWRCCRCGPVAGTYRLVGGVHCVSCYNRSLDVLRWNNRKGTAPIRTAEVLRPGWLVAGPAQGTAPPSTFRWQNGERLAVEPLPPPQFDREVIALTARPEVFALSGGRRLLIAVVAAPNELLRIAAKVLPRWDAHGHRTGPTFAELHRDGIDPNAWVRGLDPF